MIQPQPPKLSTVGAGGTLQDFIYAEKLTVLTRNRGDHFAGILVAAVAVFVLRHLYPTLVLALWFGLYSFTVFLRVYLAGRFNPSTLKAHAVRFWAAVFAAAGTLAGFVWGLTGSAILLSPDPAIQYFVMMLTAGFVAGGVIFAAAYRPAMIGFAVAATLPMVVALIARKDPVHAGLAVLVVFYTAILIGAALKVNRTIAANIVMRFNQNRLLEKVQASEAGMAEAQQLANTGNWVLDLATNTMSLSAEAYRIFGIDPANTAPDLNLIMSRVHPDDLAMVNADLAKINEKSSRPSFSHRLVMDGGVIKHVHVSPKTVWDESGQPVQVIGSVQDITERRLAEQKLEFANILLNTQMDSSRDGILVVDPNGKIVGVNRRYGELTRARVDDLIGQDYWVAVERVSPLMKDPDAFRHRAVNVAEIGTGDLEGEFELADGRIISSYRTELRTADGGYLGRASFYTDITETRRAAETLAYRDRLLATVTAATPIAVGALSLKEGVPAALAKIGESMGVDRITVFCMEPDGEVPSSVPFIWESAAVRRPFQRAELAGVDLDQAELDAWTQPLHHGKPVITHRATAQGTIRTLLEHHGTESCLHLPVLLNGKLWGMLGVETCTAPRDWAASEIETVGILADITGSLVVRERARLALATSENRFRLLTTAAQDAVFLTDESSAILQWNQAAERMIGYTAAEALGKNAIILLGLRSRWAEIEHQLSILAKGNGTTLELLIRRNGGDELWVDVSISAARVGERVEYITIMRDITARKAAEQKLQFAVTLLNTQMEASRDGIIVIDSADKIISVNQRYGEIGGHRVDDLPGQHVSVAVERVSHMMKDPAAHRREMALLARSTAMVDSGIEFEFVDGRVVTGYRTRLHGAAGEYLGRAAFYTDITESRRAAADLAYRDRLLRTIAIATAAAIGAPALEQGVPGALAQIGETMGADRILVTQRLPEDIPPLAVRFIWESPEIAVPLGLPGRYHRFDPTEMAAWLAPLLEGKPVIGQRETASGTIRAMMEEYGTHSSLIMPIAFEGALWGYVSIESCAAPRGWTTTEIETMGIMGEIISSLIVRQRALTALETSEKRFRQLTDTARDAVALTDENTVIRQWNRAAEEMFGYSDCEALGQDLVSLLGPGGQRAEIVQKLDAFSESGGRHIELPFRRKNGSEILVEISLSATEIDGAREYIAIMRDISERKIAEQNLILSNALLKTQMEASPDGVFVVDQDGGILSYNQRYAEMWRIPLAMLEDGRDSEIRAHKNALVKNPAEVMSRVDYLKAHPDETADDVLEMIDGRIFERHSVSIRAPDQKTFGRAWFYRDVTERRAAEAQAIRLARYDPLTGLANRALFVDALNHEIAHAKREATCFAVMFLDLDHFKDVNDTLGHPAGDALLKCVADRLRAATRETDTIARFGGDEFAVILSSVQDSAGAGGLAERLLTALNQPLAIGANTVQVRASIGIEVFSPNALDAETLLGHADLALYRSKAEGRGTFRFFTEDMDKDVRNRVTLGAELREAVNAGALTLLYQPQVEVTTGVITGVEALIRWPHPTRGMLTPRNFMEAAESNGAVNELGRFALRAACGQAAAWRQAGYLMPRIGLNISAVQLKAARRLEADILEVLAETRLPPHILELELTESGLIGAGNETNNVLQRLKGRGVKIAIDHFGTGYSSLDYLRRSPTDHIKIPRSFTKNVENDTSHASIVRAIIGLATELGVETIAEGVETRTQLNLIARWGCTQMQGFYFSGPVPAEDITKMLKSGGILQHHGSAVS